ncbi:DoxX family protein [Nocardia sp. NBC_01327]|uniref:DoxX family protein n=1 Tax=Nocardia sp. NBC_01327 TaxID=2903593 RepID=UPI002E14E370|nr:DoxX family protein [Nocardia sp. NBC_01327]
MPDSKSSPILSCHCRPSQPFAIAAAIGLVLYFSGAILAHIRSGDRNMVGAMVFLALSITTSVVLVLDTLLA